MSHEVWYGGLARRFRPYSPACVPCVALTTFTARLGKPQLLLWTWRPKGCQARSPNKQTKQKKLIARKSQESPQDHGFVKTSLFHLEFYRKLAGCLFVCFKMTRSAELKSFLKRKKKKKARCLQLLS